MLARPRQKEAVPLTAKFVIGLNDCGDVVPPAYQPITVPDTAPAHPTPIAGVSTRKASGHKICQLSYSSILHSLALCLVSGSICYYLCPPLLHIARLFWLHDDLPPHLSLKCTPKLFFFESLFITSVITTSCVCAVFFSKK